MGVEHSPEAYQKLSDMMSWRPGILVDASSTVAAHVLAATVSQGSGLLRMFGIESSEEEEFFDDLSRAVSATCADLDVSPAAGVQPPLVALAAAGDHAFIRRALASKLLTPNVRGPGGRTAALAAVTQGSLEALRALHRHGEKLDVADVEGTTLLHAAGGKAGFGDEDAIEIAIFLVRQGLDPEVRDAAGYAPSDHAWSAASSREDGEGTDAAEVFDSVIRSAPSFGR